MNVSQVLALKDQINVKYLTGLLIPMLVLLIILMMVVPLPTLLLDLFFTLNIALALIIVMISINTMRPLDFSSFPTVLLFATLLRLALHVLSWLRGIRAQMLQAKSYSPLVTVSLVVTMLLESFYFLF